MEKVKPLSSFTECVPCSRHRQGLECGRSEVKVAQSFLTVCNPMDYTVYGILQAGVLEWVAFPFSRGSSQPWDQTQVSRIAGGVITSWAMEVNETNSVFHGETVIKYIKYKYKCIWCITVRVYYLGEWIRLYFHVSQMWFTHSDLPWCFWTSTWKYPVLNWK